MTRVRLADLARAVLDRSRLGFAGERPRVDLSLPRPFRAVTGGRDLLRLPVGSPRDLCGDCDKPTVDLVRLVERPRFAGAGRLRLLDRPRVFGGHGDASSDARSRDDARIFFTEFDRSTFPTPLPPVQAWFGCFPLWAEDSVGALRWRGLQSLDDSTGVLRWWELRS